MLFIYFHIPRDPGQTLAEGESEKNPKIIYVCVHMWIFQTTSYHLKKILWDFSCFLRKAHIPWTSLSVLILCPIDFLSLCLYCCLSWGIPWFHCWPFFSFFFSSMLFSLYVIVLFLLFLVVEKILEDVCHIEWWLSTFPVSILPFIFSWEKKLDYPPCLASRHQQMTMLLNKKSLSSSSFHHHDG